MASFKGQPAYRFALCCMLNCPICFVSLCDFSEWVDKSVMEQEASMHTGGKKRQDKVLFLLSEIISPEHNPNLPLNIMRKTAEQACPTHSQQVRSLMSESHH